MTAPIDGRGRIRSVLEEEREFFIRSLRDLEVEHDAGDIDDVDYRALRDDYTVRAADVVRQLEALDGDPVSTGSGSADAPTAMPGAAVPPPEIPSAAPGPSAPPSGVVDPGHPTPAPSAPGYSAPAPAVGGPVDATEPADEPGSAVPAGTDDGTGRPVWRLRWVQITAAVIVAAGIAWAAIGSLGGSSQSSAARVANLRAAAQVALDKGDAVTSLKDYNAALALDPTDPTSLTGEGIVYMFASNGSPGSLLDAGLTYFQKAEIADPSYYLAYGWRGVAYADNRQYALAVSQLKTYLADVPAADRSTTVTKDVRKALGEAEQAVASAKAKSGGQA